MPDMSTILEEFADNGNSRTYTEPTHSVVSPFLVIQKRKVPVGEQIMAEDSVSVVKATQDAESVILPQRVSLLVVVRRPITGITADVTSARNLFQEIVASGNFERMIDGSSWLQ